MAASASTMVKGRANFYVDDNTSLNHANCYFPLDQGAIVAAFPEKILIGPTDLNENGEMCFSKDKTIIIPSSRLVEFVKTVRKGYNALKTNSKEEFEDTIFIYQNIYYLVSKYQFWQGEFGFTMFYTANIFTVESTGITCVPILTVLSMYFIHPLIVCSDPL